MIPLKFLYGMNNSGKLFADELIEWLLVAGFIQSQCQMSIYYKYAPDGTKIVVLSYVDDCVYWYTSETLGKWFVDTLGKRFYVKLLGYAYRLMSIRISHMEYHYISVYQDGYATSIVAKYLDIATFKTSTNFCKNTLPYDILFNKADSSTSDDQVENFNREFNIHYRTYIGSLIYLLSTRVYLSFAVHKLAIFIKTW